MSASQKIITPAMLILSILSTNVFAGDKLEKIFNSEMIGANLPYLEKITGPAKNTFSYEKNQKTNTYKVESCEVTVRVSNGTVQSLGLKNLSKKCTFDLNNFVPNVGGGKLPPLHNMTFGQFDIFTGNGKYTADCLMSCGNAADPVAYENWQASRADGGFDIELGVVLASDSAIDASNKWRNAMLKDEGEDWIIDTKFNCSNKYNSIAQKAFKNVKITSATIGFGLTVNECKP